MSTKVINGTKKRKHATEEDALPKRKDDFEGDVGLEMDSEDEGEEGPEESDDGGVDEFPEIDENSDTDEEEQDEDEEESGSDEDEDEEEDEEEESDEGESSDGSIHIFPKAKVITSKITGQPKKVYPEIEPDYDSDSSTEDVSYTFYPLLPECPILMMRRIRTV